MIVPAEPPEGQTGGQHAHHVADRANGFDERVRWRDDEATRTIGTRYGGGASGPATVILGPVRPGGPGEHGHSGGAPGEADSQAGPDQPDGPHGPASRPRHRRPLLLAGIAAGAFLLAMGGITIVEAASGKPLDALLWGKHGSGTTVQNIVTGHSGRPAAHQAHPATSPSRPAPSAVPTPTPGATAHASPSPAPSPTTPSPTPSPTGSAGQSTPVLPSPGAG